MGLTIPQILAGAHVTTAEIVGGVGIFLVSLLGSAAAAAVVLSRLPADYLLRDPLAAPPARGNLGLWLLRTVGKNLLGAFLVVLGVVLSLPGVPGQGILTILLGVMLLDIPGKHELERRIMCRPGVFRSINRLRERFGKPPLVPACGEVKGGFRSQRAAPR